jgi:ketosteroid isomerase-like protein
MEGITDMLHRLGILFGISALLLVVACASPENDKQTAQNGQQTAEPDMDRDEVRIALDSLNELWCSAFYNKNAMIAARLFADNGVLMAPPDRTFRDSIAIADFFQKTIEMNQVVKEASLKPVNLWIVGTNAFEIGHYLYIFEPHPGFPYRSSGLYYAHWHKAPHGNLEILYYTGVPSSYEQDPDSL